MLHPYFWDETPTIYSRQNYRTTLGAQKYGKFPCFCLLQDAIPRGIISS